MSAESFEPPTLEHLSKLLPAYEFQSFIAQGGMGAVYKARQLSLDRDVAIKILPREFGADPEFRKSFEHEAKAMARLNHPNLIAVYDFGDADGMPYIVMEFVRGKSLYHSAYQRKIDPVQAVTIVKGICDGLAHAHDQGVIHRDIKPANILLTPKAEPKIGDFGLARPAGADHSGVVMGTPGYAAPEITRQPNLADRGSDIFALGVVLYELLVGRCPPYEAKPPLASAVSGCDPALDRICEKATHPVVASRYPTAEAMSAALDAWLRRAAEAPARKVPAGPGARPVPKAAAPRPVPVESLPQSSGSGDFFRLVRNLVVLAAVILATAVAWKKLRTLQAEDAAKQRAYLESKSGSKGLPVSPAEEERNPWAPGGKVPDDLRPAEDPLKALARLKSDLAAGKRDKFPAGSIPLGRSDVLVIPTAMTWHDAKEFAESHGAHLFVPTATQDLDRVSGAASGSRVGLWIGAGRNPAGGWIAVDGTSWDPGARPEGKGNFALLDERGEVKARNPGERHAFAIQWQRDASNPTTLADTLRRTAASLGTDRPVFPVGTAVFEGRHLVCIFPRSITHAEALAYAGQAGGHLAVADTREKNDWLADQLDALDLDSGVWIGAGQDGTAWKWSTGAPMTFTRWDEKPTDANGGGVAMLLPGGTWKHASPRDHAAGFIIEWEHREGTPYSSGGEGDLPPAVRDLEAKAKTLVASLENEREKELLANVRNFNSSLDTWLRRQNRSESQRWSSEVASLKQLVQDNRIPGKIDRDSDISLSEDMAKACSTGFAKQNAIDAAFTAKATKLRDAYVAKLADAVLEAKAKGRPDQAAALGSRVNEAADLDDWLESFGVTLQAAAAPATAAGGSFVGKWTPTANPATYTFLEDGTSTISSGARGTWIKKAINDDEVVYIVEWESGIIDTLTLAEDGDTLTGTNNRNGTIKLVRKPD